MIQEVGATANQTHNGPFTFCSRYSLNEMNFGVCDPLFSQLYISKTQKNTCFKRISQTQGEFPAFLALCALIPNIVLGAKIYAMVQSA